MTHQSQNLSPDNHPDLHLPESDYVAGVQAFLSGQCAQDDQEAQQAWDTLCATANGKLTTVITSACLKEPGIAGMMAPGNWHFSEEEECMGVGRNGMVVNPQFVMTETHARIEVVLRHEWLHVALNHIARRDAFLTEMNDPANKKTLERVFNAGSDLEVNSILHDDLVRTGLYTIAFIPGYRRCAGLPLGLTAEAYTRIILATPEIAAVVE